MDVLMGMVVTSIVVSIVFFLLTSVNKQNHEYQTTRLELNDYLILNNLLKRELEQTEKVVEVPNGLVFMNGEDEIYYQLRDQQLWRADQLSEKEVYPNCNSISITAKSDNDLVRAFDIKVLIQERELICHFHEDYGKAEIINNTLLSGL